MTFTIDTGVPERLYDLDRVQVILDAARDAAADPTDQRAVDARVIDMVTGELREPRRPETLRRRFVQLWPLVAPLAFREPEQFDAILLEYAERSTTIC